MSYTYLQTRQAINGFVFTIDGYLTYSPMTDVIGGVDVTPEGIGNWIVQNPGFFYNTSRGTTIDRTGSFIKIYDADTKEPLALAVILDPNLISGPNTFLRFKVVKYEYEVSFSDLSPSLNLELRLEDPWKFCTTVPSWIPAAAESRDRWIPIMSKDVEPSLGQKLDLRGGFGSVDGMTLPMVLDARYQSKNRIQRMFAEDAASYKYNNEANDEIGFDNVIEINLFTSTTQISVLNRSNPLDAASRPDCASDYLTYYPFLLSSGTELALPEPWFIDTEAIIAESFTSGIPGINGTINSFTTRRGIDDTPETQHSKYTVIFNGIPYVIGQSCKLYEVQDILTPSKQNWILTYRGIVENIPMDEGLAAFNIELSSLTFTARVNSTLNGQETTIERRKSPARDSAIKDFYNSFIVSQANAQDTFAWVKIGPLAFPLLRIENIDYLEAVDSRSLRINYLRDWDLTADNISDRLISTLESGVTDVGYKIGFVDRFGIEREVSQTYNPRNLAYGFSNEYEVDVSNWFRIGQLNSPTILAQDSPWGFYFLEPASDSTQHNNFDSLRTDSNLRTETESSDDLREDEAKVVTNFLSTEPPKLIHLFQRYCKGYDKLDLIGISRDFFYTGDDQSLVSTDIVNYSLEVSVIDVILQVLISTGSGYTEVDTERYRMVPGTNGAWDLIPREMALGIPLEDIDLNSFLKVKTARGGMNKLTVTNIYMEAGEDSAQDFLEKQILKPFFFSIATNSEGKIVLVDIADVLLGPETKTIDLDKFARKNGDRTRVSLTYEAKDLVDSFTYRWKEPSRTRWDDPYFNRTLTSSGVEASLTTRVSPFGERTFSVKSKARIFPRIQSSPIEFDLRYAPVAKITPAAGYEERVGPAALFYLSRFNRIVPRATFELLWDSNSPDIGDTISFNLDAIPDKMGLVNNPNKVLIGKIIDIKIDRKAKVAEYTAILTDSTLIGTELLWNLTMELIAPVGDTWTVSSNLFCLGDNPLIDNSDVRVFKFDYSQFLVGSKVIVWDKNWRYVTDTEIVAATDNAFEFDDDTSFAAGYRVTLVTIDDTQSVYKAFLTWFQEGQVYL